MANLKEIVLGAAALAVAGVVIVKYQDKHFAQATRNLRLKIVGVNVQEGDVIINVKILNPNNEDMEVKSFVGEMKAGGKKVASVHMFGDYVAKGNNEITIPLIAKPAIANMLQNLKTIFSRGVKTVIEFTGTINVNNHPIPISLSYSK